MLEIQDTLKCRKARNTAQELAAVYHDKEQQQTIMQQEAENTRQKAVILIIVLVLIAVVTLAAVVLRKNRIISRKNQSLAQQITEAMTYKERYMQELRLEYSTLLMSTRPEMSISQIAIDCGFSSYAYYCKCFRRRFGMTPTEFRQSAEQKQ